MNPISWVALLIIRKVIGMKVLVCDPIAPRGVELLRGAGYEVDVKDDICAEDLDKVIHDYDGVIVRSRTKIRKPTIDKAKKLKVIARGGVGLDNIDADYAEKKGIKVVNTPAASSVSVAELALAHMFALARQIVRGTKGCETGKWEKKEIKGIELMDKTLGLVGVGRIGQELAKRCHGLGMKVIGYDLYVKESPLPGIIKMYNELDEMLPHADFVSLHIPFDPNIGNTIGPKEIAKMKKGSYLINCARGGTVDEQALLDALNSGHIAGAGLDVFETEPPTCSMLLEHPNTTLTPHIGAQTKEGSARVGVAVAEVMIEALKSTKK